MTLREYFDRLLATCPSCGAELPESQRGRFALRCVSEACLYRRMRERMIQIATEF